MFRRAPALSRPGLRDRRFRKRDVPATFFWFLFDWRGRIGRSPYRIAWLVVALFAAALDYLPTGMGAFLLGFAALQLIVAAALDAKRLHDIGLSALWLVATSVAGVAVAAFLVDSSPALAHALSEKLAGPIGARAAASPLVCIVVAGLGLGAAVRSPFLWTLGSRAGGAAYEHDPRARAEEAGAVDGATIAGADAAIAQALIDRRLQQAAARAAAVAAEDRKSPRKTFGRRAA
jgi:uncharacterized membrane protein YhaH (DUF805 family)